jgi:hypothetical protein
VAEDLFDDLEAEAEALAPSIAATTSEPVSQEDPTICKRGPCRHFIETQFPTGIEIQTSALAQRRCFCRAGVQFQERRADARAISILSTAPILPIDCSIWAPLRQDEIDDLDERRLLEQDRHQVQLAAAAALSTTQEKNP